MTPMEVERFRTQSGTSCQIAGEGPPVVLVHGVGLDHEMWFAQREALAERFRVITFDLLNHGDSPAISGTATLYHFSGQLDRLLDELQIVSTSIVGFSFGVPITQFFALNHQHRINKLVFLNGVYARTEAEAGPARSRLHEARSKGTGALIGPAMKRWFSDEFQETHPHVVAMIKRRLQINDEEAFLGAYEVFCYHDDLIAGRLAGIECPALVLTGEHDPGSTPALSERMAEALPNATLHILPGQRHMAPIEAADEVNRLILDFLS